jgi:hypothetical protein
MSTLKPFAVMNDKRTECTVTDAGGRTETFNVRIVNDKTYLVADKKYIEFTPVSSDGEKPKPVVQINQSGNEVVVEIINGMLIERPVDNKKIKSKAGAGSDIAASAAPAPQVAQTLPMLKGVPAVGVGLAVAAPAPQVASAQTLPMLKGIAVAGAGSAGAGSAVAAPPPPHIGAASGRPYPVVQRCGDDYIVTELAGRIYVRRKVALCGNQLGGEVFAVEEGMREPFKATIHNGYNPEFLPVVQKNKDGETVIVSLDGTQQIVELEKKGAKDVVKIDGMPIMVDTSMATLSVSTAGVSAHRIGVSLKPPVSPDTRGAYVDIRDPLLCGSRSLPKSVSGLSLGSSDAGVYHDASSASLSSRSGSISLPSLGGAARCSGDGDFHPLAVASEIRVAFPEVAKCISTVVGIDNKLHGISGILTAARAIVAHEKLTDSPFASKVPGSSLSSWYRS